MEFIVETILKGIVRSFIYVIFEIIIRFLFYYTAAISLRVLTLGKYPSYFHQEPYESPSSLLITAAGAIFYIFLLIHLISTY